MTGNDVYIYLTYPFWINLRNRKRTTNNNNKWRGNGFFSNDTLHNFYFIFIFCLFAILLPRLNLNLKKFFFIFFFTSLSFSFIWFSNKNLISIRLIDRSIDLWTFYHRYNYILYFYKLFIAFIAREIRLIKNILRVKLK